MNKEELVEFKRKEEEERNKKDIAFEKLFNRVFYRDTLNKDNQSIIDLLDLSLVQK